MADSAKTKTETIEPKETRPERKEHPQTPVPHMQLDELAEWQESLDDLLFRYGEDTVLHLLNTLRDRAAWRGVPTPFRLNTPYINTIPVDRQPPYPGNGAIERRLRSLMRWNAMAMVVRANRDFSGIGGHISTYASAATLFEVGFNHFFHARTDDHTGDLVYFQGHASPGVYARAFVEGRLSEEQLVHFRREAPREAGLPSYPHPWLMPQFWQFATVSMGLAPIQSIYYARFLKYLHYRGLLDTAQSKVWCFLGDGEVDEPESLGSLSLATREELDNLIFVVNCNLQRLDGPVRGNGKIIQELEAIFRGAGWNCIKVIWGSDWDPLLNADDDGLLRQQMDETLDGQFQKYTVESGEYIRENFFGKWPELREMVDHLSDEQLEKLNRGGHDPEKVYAAYQAAVEHQGSPTVILAKTIKGYGLGEAGEGRNVTHKQKMLNEDELRAFRNRFDVPLSDEDIETAPFYRPSEDSEEIQYLRQRRKELGGDLPARATEPPRLEIPPLEEFTDLLKGSGDRPATTTMAFGRLLGQLLKHERIGPRIVPIIPDEARTFGMESLFRKYGIYASQGQRYEPVDVSQLMFYREAQDGQILEEGITEAGSMSSFIAAGTCGANLGFTMVPFFMFYSMFGFQRVGDLIWAAADSRAKGFLLGGTAGRTTLNGEGLQHQDGHSHLVATTIPTLQAYDPAFAYEFALIVHDGMHRMYEQNEDIFYYITMYNEAYEMPAMPEGVQDGVLNGMYRLGDAGDGDSTAVHLLGSGPILREVQRAQQILVEEFDVTADVWSVTSFSRLCRDARAADRHNDLRPGNERKTSHLHKTMRGLSGVFVAATDYVHLVADQIREWIPGTYLTLGTDGFGRSDTREVLRDHFEVSAEFVAYAALRGLAREQKFKRRNLRDAAEKLNLDPRKIDPATA